MKYTIDLPECEHSVTMKLKKSDEHTTCDLTFESDSGKHRFL